MSDAAMGPLWLAVNLLLFGGAWMFAGRLFLADSFLNRLMHATVLIWAWIVAVSVVLGAFGWLAPWSLLAGGLVGAGVFLGAARACRGSSPQNEVRQSLDTGEKTWLFVWSAVFVVLLARIILNGLLRFPTDWDSMMYHIPLVNQWLQRGNLYAPADAFWYVPGNNELITLWLVSPFSGDFLVPLTNLPGAILLGLGAKALADNLGVGRSLGHLTGLAAISTWPFLRQLVDAENDVAAAGLFLASLAYGLRSMNQNKPNVMMAAICIGLLAGVKYYALGYAGVAWASLAGATWLQRHRIPALRWSAISALAILALAGYWYVRNYAVTGSPLYPKGLTQATDLWDQMRPNSWSSSLLGSNRPEVWPMVLGCVARMAGPCHWLAMVLAPLSILWLLGTGFWRQKKTAACTFGTARIAMALVMAGAGLVWFATPNTVETNPGTMNMLLGQYLPVRFGLGFLSLAIVALAVMMHDVGQELAWLLDGFARSTRSGGSAAGNTTLVRIGQELPTVAFGLLIAVQLRSHWGPVMAEGILDLTLVALNLWMFGALVTLLWSGWPRWRNVVALTLMPMIGGAAAWGTESLAHRWHAGFVRHYDSHLRIGLIRHLAEMSPPPGPIGVCDYRYYPFLGSRRQFTACRPLWTPTWGEFRAYLQDHHVAYVVARKDDPFPQSRYEGNMKLIVAHPTAFRLLREDNYYLLFRVVNEPDGSIPVGE
jgi:hypothetical protein